jgi:DNA-binding NarL/FixJ family response regulator
MIRLLIADDHAIVRGGLKQLFAMAQDIQVIGEARSGAEVLECLHREPFDLLLLDLNMPGIHGADLIARIKLHQPQLRILVFSMHNEPEIAARMLKAGVGGYITKDCDPEDLLAAVRKVAGYGNYIDPVIASQMAFAGVDRRSEHGRLTEREMTVLRLLARGLSVKEIGEQLAISGKTVSTHKSRLMEKLATRSMADLMRYALVHELTE